MRKFSYMRTGCTIFESKTGSKCMPLAFWRNEDIEEYIKIFKLEIAPIYKMGFRRSGCLLCLFGYDQAKKYKEITDLQILKNMNHPLFRYAWEKLKYKEIFEYFKWEIN